MSMLIGIPCRRTHTNQITGNQGLTAEARVDGFFFWFCVCGGVSCEFELFMSKTDYPLTQRYIESSSDAPGFGFFFFFLFFCP